MRNVAPDLIVHFGGLAWRSIGGVGYPTIHVQENDTGPDDCNHAQHGAFILASSNNPLQGEIEGAHLLDIAPTLLELGGYDVPPSMQGRSLVAGLDAGRAGGGRLLGRRRGNRPRPPQRARLHRLEPGGFPRDYANSTDFEGEPARVPCPRDRGLPIAIQNPSKRAHLRSQGGHPSGNRRACPRYERRSIRPGEPTHGGSCHGPYFSAPPSSSADPGTAHPPAL